MCIKKLWKRWDIQAGVQEYQSTENALLLDVRTPAEYRRGHIPGSKNLPLHAIKDIAGLAPDKDTPLYLYCYTGDRSQQAVKALHKLGYTHAKNIGGFGAYTGPVEQ